MCAFAIDELFSDDKWNRLPFNGKNKYLETILSKVDVQMEIFYINLFKV